MAKLNVGIIGAGAAGLCAAKYAKSFGHSVTVFEQCAEIGGTWVYKETSNIDDCKLDTHANIYENLRTITPKEIIGFQDHPIPSYPLSFITSDEVLSYLKSYAETFRLHEIIKFRHHVIHVRPVDSSKWEVTVENLLSNIVKTYVFDAILICNGIFGAPFTPYFEGAEEFKGRQIHSQNYRRPDGFKDKTVLIVGAGRSGIDLTHVIASMAKSVILSHHKHNESLAFSSNVIRKGSISKFTNDAVVFNDGSETKITDVIYCTGYNVSLPFLSSSCGLYLKNNYVYPLYKHCINPAFPTMAFIGHVRKSVVNLLIETQVRFVMKYLNGNVILPTYEEMIAESEKELSKRSALGWSMKDGHSFAGEIQIEYLKDLTTTASIDSVPEILLKILDDHIRRFSEEPNYFRDDVYTIIDEHNFERHSLRAINNV